MMSVSQRLNIVSLAGGMKNIVTVVYKRLASLLTEKHDIALHHYPPLA